jgi:hypothetical protein
LGIEGFEPGNFNLDAGLLSALHITFAPNLNVAIHWLPHLLNYVEHAQSLLEKLVQAESQIALDNVPELANAASVLGRKIDLFTNLANGLTASPPRVVEFRMEVVSLERALSSLRDRAGIELTKVLSPQTGESRLKYNSSFFAKSMAAFLRKRVNRVGQIAPAGSKFTRGRIVEFGLADTKNDVIRVIEEFRDICEKKRDLFRDLPIFFSDHPSYLEMITGEQGSLFLLKIPFNTRKYSDHFRDEVQDLIDVIPFLGSVIEDVKAVTLDFLNSESGGLPNN